MQAPPDGGSITLSAAKYAALRQSLAAAILKARTEAGAEASRWRAEAEAARAAETARAAARSADEVTPPPTVEKAVGPRTRSASATEQGTPKKKKKTTGGSEPVAEPEGSEGFDKY